MAKKGGLIVAAVAVAIVLANAEDDGDVPAVDGYAGNLAASREAMARGESAVAWSRLGLTAAPGTPKRRDRDCVAHSYGQIRDYLRRVPCQWVDRLLFTVDGEGGDPIAVAVAWVGFATPGQAAEFRRIDDTWGTGQVRPLPGATVGLPDVRLSGQHYASRQVGAVTVVAEAEEAGGGQLRDAFLDDIAGVAVLLPHR